MTTDYRNKINSLMVERKSAIRRRDVEQDKLQQSESNLLACRQASEFITATANVIQQQVHQGISAIVTRCIESVFDNPYEFYIDFQTKRNRTEAVLVMRRDDKEFRDPKREVGVGVIDVASLGLRVACIMLSRPRKRRVLILDEPFKNVRGALNKQRLRGMVKMLSEDMGFQFIINVDVEAYPEFALGKIVEMD